MLRRLPLCAALLLVACTASPVRTSPAPTSDYADVPEHLVAPAGLVKVQLVDSIGTPEPNRMILGRFNALERTIYLTRQITSPQQRLKTMYHELCHIVLADSGIQNVLYTAVDPQFVEMICDAFASQRMAELSRTR